MAMTINRLMMPEGAAMYYTEGWMRVLESHMAYLREISQQNVVAVTPHQAYKYEADLFGLLQELKVRPEYRWVTMRLNDMTNPAQLRVDREFLILPDFQEIEKLRTVYQTTSKKIN